MGKIVCDVCGTSYPESGTQCPICGCVRPADVTTILSTENDAVERPSGTYTYVKGGRFSKANVKKRNQGKEIVSVEPAKQPSESDKKPKQKSDTWFVVAIIALLVAIVAVVIYIAIRFFAPALNAENQPNIDATPSTTEQTIETTETTTGDILCEEILLNKSEITFDRMGAAIFLKATVMPEDTTEDIYFVSSDDNVVTVGADGRITAVGAGEAVVTVYCGAVEATCQVLCDFEQEGTAHDETTAPTEPTVAETIPDPSGSDGDFDYSSLKMNWVWTLVENPNVGDVTLTKLGEVWVAYSEGEGKIAKHEINFSSSDTSVVVIDENGVVTAVGAGEAVVTADYRGYQVKCRILCVF